MKRKYSRIFITVLAVAMTALALNAAGAVFYVDADRPDDSGAGISWATAKRTIQAGINAGIGTDEVWVKGSTYVETIILRSGVSVYGGFSGTETARTQRDFHANISIIDGGDTPRTNAVVRINGLVNTRFDGFTVTGGNNTSFSTHGGAIYAHLLDNTNTIAHCRLIQNRAIAAGGLWVSNGIGDGPKILNCVISGNISGNSAGIYISNGRCMVDSCYVIGNRSTDHNAGGIFFDANAVLSNSIISGNMGAQAGGISCEFGCSPIIKNCTIAGNSGPSGTGIRSGSGASPIVFNSIFSDNPNGAISSNINLANITHCLFFANPNGDGITPGGSNVFADPRFVMDGAGAISGAWTATPVYNSTTKRTVLTNRAIRLTQVPTICSV